MKTSYCLGLIFLVVLAMSCTPPQDSHSPATSSQDTLPQNLDGTTPTEVETLVEAPDDSSPNSTGFLEVGQAVSWSLVNHDLESLDAYIHPDSGLFFVYKPGAIPIARNVKKTSEIKDFYPFLDHLKGDPVPDFTFSPLNESPPSFDCDPMKFKKTGQFAGEKGGCHHLSMVLGIDMSAGKGSNEHALACAKDLETYSREIVITTSDGSGGWIFWLSKIQDAWWITYWDISRTDCGA